jgi:hypothetical protein
MFGFWYVRISPVNMFHTRDRKVTSKNVSSGPMPAYNPNAPHRPALETSVPATTLRWWSYAEADGEDADDDEMIEGQQEE